MGRHKASPYKYVHSLAIEKDKRADGRKMDEVRALYAETGLLKRTHGSALFTRGMTQVLNVVTLGTMTESQRLDGITVEYEDWWFNVRGSNTEPVIRLNLEARTEELMEEKRDEVLGVIRG